jgi:hypothetical protein
MPSFMERFDDSTMAVQQVADVRGNVDFLPRSLGGTPSR